MSMQTARTWKNARNKTRHYDTRHPVPDLDIE